MCKVIYMEKNNLRSQKHYAKLKLVLRVSVGANLFLVAILLCLFIFRQVIKDNNNNDGVVPWSTVPPDRGALAHSGSTGQICLPCDYQLDFRDTLYEKIVKTESNRTICCLQHDQDLQDLILDMEEQNRYLPNSGVRHTSADTLPDTLKWWVHRNYAAHLYVESTGQKITWKVGGHRTSFLRNLTLTNGNRHLSAPGTRGTGMYFIYSLYTFDFRKLSSHKPTPIGTHNIYRHTPSITNSRRQRVWAARFGGENTPKRQTSFLCGVISLNSNDAIETEAMSFSLEENVTTRHIDTAPFSNYFGMFKLFH